MQSPTNTIQMVDDLNAKLTSLTSKLETKKLEQVEIQREFEIYEEKLLLLIKREMKLKSENRLKDQKILELEKKLASCLCQPSKVQIPIAITTGELRSPKSSPVALKTPNNRSPNPVLVGNDSNNNNSLSGKASSSVFVSVGSPSFLSTLNLSASNSPNSSSSPFLNITESLSARVFDKLTTGMKTQNSNYQRLQNLFLSEHPEDNSKKLRADIENLKCIVHSDSVESDSCSNDCCFKNITNIRELASILGEFASAASPFPSPATSPTVSTRYNLTPMPTGSNRALNAAVTPEADRTLVIPSPRLQRQSPTPPPKPRRGPTSVNNTMLITISTSGFGPEAVAGLDTGVETIATTGSTTAKYSGKEEIPSCSDLFSKICAERTNSAPKSPKSKPTNEQ